MISEICFFNHFHNGDIFNSKSFVQDIIRKLDKKIYYYGHSTNSKILIDTNVSQIPLQSVPLDNYKKMGYNEHVLFVNTWIGSYFDVLKGECTLQFSYKMYKEIYRLISDVLKLEIPITVGEIDEYWPTIDFSKFDLLPLNNFISKFAGTKKILISNGPGHSGQCSYNGNISDIILELADYKKDYTFIVTHKFMSGFPNIIFTDDMEVSGGDLNEISYISRFCNLIIGRSSGPFTFSITKESIDNPEKTFFCFGNTETDYFIHGTPTKCKSIFHQVEDSNKLKEHMFKVVGEL